MRGRGLFPLVSAALCLVTGCAEESIREEPPPPPPEPPPVVLSPEQQDAAAVARETEGGRWDRDAIARVRTLLRERSPTDATNVMLLAGFERSSARQIGRIFSSRHFDEWVGKRALIMPSFLRIGVGAWELTPESALNLRLPFHPKLPGVLAPPASLGPAKGTYERCESIGRRRYVSAIFADSLRCTLGFRGHRFHLVTSKDLLREDWSFADRVDRALSNVPPEHLALVRQIVIDPGDDPTRSISASTSWDGTEVSLFLAGAGRDVKQESLDRTTAHEVGHVVSLQQEEPFWVRWDAAIVADKLGVSMYGMTNRREDFAEAYELYLGGGRSDATTRARHANRFAIIDSLFKP
jgi:hypothetical protein